MVTDKLLAVLRLADPSCRFYETWLHKAPEIKGTGFGIEHAKCSLQVEVNRAPKLPEGGSMPTDITTALETKGSDVMVFFIVKGANPYAWLDVPRDLYSQSPQLEPELLKLPIGEPEPTDKKAPPPTMPLLATVELIAQLDCEYHRSISTAFRKFYTEGHKYHDTDVFRGFSHKKMAEFQITPKLKWQSMEHRDFALAVTKYFGDSLEILPK